MVHEPRAAMLVPGQSIAVRTRFDGEWAEGFRVCRECDGRYVVERCSDGFELPVDFDDAEVRPTANTAPDD